MMRRAYIISSVFAFCICLLFAAGVHPQTFRGQILGTVTDQNGAVVQGATVTAKNVGTGIERSATTDSDGNYTIPELAVGSYEVRVESTNFQTQTVRDVAVGVASERRIDVTLSAAGASVDVLVAAQQSVETSSTTLGGTIQSRTVEDLPVNGRDFTKLLVLVPGAGRSFGRDRFARIVRPFQRKR